MSHYSHQDELIDLIATALRRARLVHRQISDVILPVLPPERRTFAEQLMRRIGMNEIFQDAFLADILAFRALLERQATAGTHSAWVADEHDVHGGYQVQQRDPCASSLKCAAGDLIDLRDALEVAMDYAKAVRLAEELLDA